MQKKENFYTDNPDILFHLSKRTDFAALFDGLSAEEREATSCTTVEEFQATATNLLETMGEICGSVLAANAQQVEKEEVHLKNGEVELGAALQQSLQALLEFGTPSMGVAPKFGGLGLPFLIEASANEIIMRACPSTGLNIVWYSSIAHIIQKFGTDEIKEQVIPRIASGEWSGSMALTEPDAGSDLGNLRTYGEEQSDGRWKLYGSKRFISNGNGQVSLVLAMNKKGVSGLQNLSLYMCLRKQDGRDNYKVTKLEEKLGLHGSATCELNFDGSDAVLLGENGKGFAAMLYLMNDARIAVSFQGLGYMEAIYRLTMDFASTRKTWGKPLAQHELIAERLLDLETEIKAVRSLCYQAGLYQSLLYQTERRLKDKTIGDEQRQKLEKDLSRYRKRVRRWTPLLKWYTAERAIHWAREGLQIHGGYGYTKEYRAEWWLRESIILAIYEGTSQIQGLMCMKDTLKDVIRNPKSFIEGALGLKVQSLRANDALWKKLYRAKQIVNSSIMSILVRLLKVNVRATISENKEKDLLRMVKLLSKEMVKMENVGPALLHAERLCEMKAIVALGEALVRDADVDPERRYLAERFLNKNLPRLNMLKAEIEMDDPVIAERLAFEHPHAVADGAQGPQGAVGK